MNERIFYMGYGPGCPGVCANYNPGDLYGFTFYGVDQIREGLT
jgi:hypothetical protein